MKESITKFDLESAFKALDEIEIPRVGKVIANKPALTEIFSRKSKLDALMEEYYDISSNDGLEDAKEAREAEVAQAKLARIEKIVDLDAESAEDLLTSYVGKYIIQCPQCMTLFYKNPEDVVASEEDPTTVNLNEICQHCGNESGYSLIGKVGEAEPESEEEPAAEDEELDLDFEDDEASTEADTEEAPAEDLNFDDELEELDLDIEDDEPAEEEEQKKEESFTATGGEQLTEQLDEDDFLTNRIEDVMYYGKFLQAHWVKDAPTVESLRDYTYRVTRRNGGASVIVKFDVTNMQDSTLRFTVDGKPFVTKYANEAQDFILEVLDAAYRKQFDINLDEKAATEAFPECEALVEALADDKELDAKLEAHSEYIEYLRNMIAQEEDALGKTDNAQVKDAIQRRIDAFKVDLEAALPAAVKNDEAIDEPIEELEAPDTETDAKAEQEAKKEALAANIENALTEALHEELDTEVSDAEFEQLMNSSEFKKPISDTAVRAMLAMENEENSKKEESLDSVFNDVEELQENALESMISDSLVELYGNVAGFRLKGCSYEDSKFMVEGVIHFTSGNTRKTTYTFNEALVEANKVTLRGLNEKLGNNKQFFITGYAENKTFITESFKTAKTN